MLHSRSSSNLRMLLKLMVLVKFRAPGYVSGRVSYKVNNGSSRSMSPTRMAYVRIVVDSSDTTITVDMIKVVERPNSAAIPPKRAHR